MTNKANGYMRLKQALRGARVLRPARVLESRLTAAVESAAETFVRAGAPPTLEVVTLACDEVARHVQPAGRGRYTFPFGSVTVTFVAATPEEEARFDAICTGPPSLEDRVVRRLVSAGCDTQPDIAVAVEFTAAPDPAWIRPEFHVALAKATRAARPAIASAIRVDLLITHGTADRGAYSFTTLPVAIGRGADVRDHRQQLVRVNQVAFVEGDGDINHSVSRRHARIELDPHTLRPRLVDDNSAQGTSIIRGGRGIAVPRGSRGLGLQTDDEIVLGQARMKIRIGPRD